MTSFVLDCSVVISWLIPDEVSNFNTLEQLATREAIVPTIWHLEVGNVLLNAQRSKRITSEQRYSAMNILDQLPIKIDNSTSKYAWQETMRLAESNNLSLYDASYLELALRMNIPIATFDKQLIIAAKKKNVPILT